ncbi:MAG: hypothetical protein ABSF90_31960, partial [Syntrophobacteraceae bacterium]
SWLRTGPTRELCGKEPSQKKELFRNGGNFTLDRCLSMGDPFYDTGSHVLRGIMNAPVVQKYQLHPFAQRLRQIEGGLPSSRKGKIQ